MQVSGTLPRTAKRGASTGSPRVEWRPRAAIGRRPALGKDLTVVRVVPGDTIRLIDGFDGVREPHAGLFLIADDYDGATRTVWVTHRQRCIPLQRGSYKRVVPRGAPVWGARGN